MTVLVPPAGRVEPSTVRRGHVIVSIQCAERLPVRVAESIRRVAHVLLMNLTFALTYQSINQS